MAFPLIERYMESAMEGMLDKRLVRVLKGIDKIAAKQGGLTTAENYQLLGKRVLIVLGVAVAAVQVTAYVVARKSEEQRIERVVRRVLDEERQEADAQAH